MKEVTDQLTDEGVKLFADAFDKLLGAVEKEHASARQPKVSPQTYILPAISRGGKNDPRRLAGKGKVRRLWATRRHALDRHGRRQVARLARHHRRTDRSRRAFEDCRRGCQERRLHRHPAAWAWADPVCVRMSSRMTYGKIAGFPAAARARFDRSRAGQSIREQDQSGENAVHRFEQIGHHARTQHLQAILLRAGQAGWSARMRPATASSPSPIPDRKCSRSRRAIISATFLSAFPALAGAIPPSQISAWCRRAVMGLDIESRFLAAPRKWSDACRPPSPSNENPGVVLGVILGTLPAPDATKSPFSPRPESATSARGSNN